MQCGEGERTIRRMEVAEVECFECREKGHKCRKCPLWIRRKNEERVVHVARPQKAQQEKRPAHPIRGKAQEGERRLRRVEGSKAACPTKGNTQQEEWKRSSWEMLRKRAKWYCGPIVPRDAELWELGWHSQGAIVTYLRCPRCGKGGCYAEDDWGQGVVPYWKRKKMSWYGCKGEKEQSSAQARDSRSVAKEEKAVWPREVKAQQSGTQSGELESTAKEGDSQREVRRTFGMLREVWLNIGVEKIDMHEGVMIKVLLDSSTTGIFMDRQTAARYGFKL